MHSATLIREAVACSGPFREPAGKLYGSFNLPGFVAKDAQRDTELRLDQLRVPEDLEGLTVLDVGCGVGEVALALAARGAKVEGLEFNPERVRVANAIAGSLELDATFHRYDANEPGIPPGLLGRTFDMVFCLSLDGHVSDRKALYRFLVDRMKGEGFFESCVNDLTFKQLANELVEAGVRDVYDLGDSSHPSEQGGGWSRRIARLQRYEPFMPAEPALATADCIVQRFRHHDSWNRLRLAYHKLRGMPGVPEMIFDEELVCRMKGVRGANLSQVGPLGASSQTRATWAAAMVRFVGNLNSRGLAHRNLHSVNVVVGDRQELWVTGWEYVAEQSCPFAESYDLTGRGLPSPDLTNGQTVFNRGPGDIKSVAELLELGRDWFRKVDPVEAPDEAPVDAGEPSGAFVVLGIHRSGSSVTAGILEHLGVSMGGPGEVVASNARGQFEDRDFLKMHREALGEEDLVPGRYLPDAWRYPKPAASVKWRTRYASLATARRLQRAWGVKDPRLCFLLDELLAVVGAPKVVHVSRDVDSSARSLFRRDNPVDPSFTMEQAVEVSRLHESAKWKALANFKGPVLHVRYEDILSDPKAAVFSIARFAGINPHEDDPRVAAAIGSVIQPGINP